MTLVGSKVGHIRIVEALGHGGMGEVYVGLDETLQRKVAVKAIGARWRLSPVARARFLREARILSNLEHPDICHIYDYIEGADQDFLVLELISGRNLHEALKENLDGRLKLQIAERLARVLVAAHEKDVVHRDLKPSNVMLTRENDVKVLDFGLARVTPSDPDRPTTDAVAEASSPADESEITSQMPTRTSAEAETELLYTRPGAVLGTPAYMSPEQARGEPPNAASDLYSLGLMFQHLFTGKPPYPKGLGSAALIEKAAKGESLPVTGVDHDHDLAELIGRLESLAPSARPSALETAERLRWIRDKPRRRLRKLVAAAVLVVVALSATKYTFDLRRERDQAEQARDEVQSVVDFLVDLFEVSDPGEARGNTITVREILDKGSRQIAHQLEDRPLTRARMMDTMGTVYRKLGLYDVAEPLLQDSLADRREQVGPTHLLVSESLNSLAVLHERRGKWDEGETLFREALAIRETKLGPDDAAVAEILRGLAYLYMKQGRFEEAETLLDRTLAIREAALDPEHPDVAATLRDLGIVYYMVDRYDEAETHYRRALTIQKKVLGSDHPAVGQTINSLASLYFANGRYEDTEPLYLEALSIREKTLGPKHPDVAISLNNLALLYYYQERLDEVEPLYRRALTIREEALGARHLDVAESLDNFATLYYSQERLDEAETHYRQALSIREESLGPEHISIPDTLNNLASLADDQGRYAEAEQLTLRSLGILEPELGPEHPAVAECLFNLAHIYHRHFDRFDQAERLYARALAVRREALGPDTEEVAATIAEYADLLRERGRTEEAEAL